MLLASGFMEAGQMNDASCFLPPIFTALLPALQIYSPPAPYTAVAATYSQGRPLGKGFALTT